MMYKEILRLITCCICVLGFSCKQNDKNQLFTSLSADETGIKFSNDVDETKLPGDALNEFAYMGGGVGVIDVNNDGLKDHGVAYFGGNCR